MRIHFFGQKSKISDQNVSDRQNKEFFEWIIKIFLIFRRKKNSDRQKCACIISVHIIN